jgi:hypothetical protein
LAEAAHTRENKIKFMEKLMNSQQNDIRPPRLDIIHAVLESALDSGVQNCITACRRLLRADLGGWRRHANRTDGQVVLDAYDDMRADEGRDIQE